MHLGSVQVFSRPRHSLNHCGVVPVRDFVVGPSVNLLLDDIAAVVDEKDKGRNAHPDHG